MNTTKTKTKFKISWFDIIILVLIVLIAAAAYYFSHRESSSTDRVCTYQLEFQSLPEGMENEISIGDPVTDTVKNYEIGTVTAIEAKPGQFSTTDEEAGVIHQVDKPGYINLYVTVEVDAAESDSAITTKSGYALRVGASASCQIGHFKATGYIVTLDR